MEIWSQIIIFLAIVVVVPPIVLYLETKRILAETQSPLIRLPDLELHTQSLPPEVEFLQHQGFQYAGRYKYGLIELTNWRQDLAQGAPLREISIMRVRHRTIYDFVSIIDSDHSLTTTTGNSAFVQPRPPGSFLQSTNKKDLRVVWEQHTEAERFIISKYSLTVGIVSKDFIERVNEGIKKQAQYLFSVRFWPLKAPYWYYIKRHLMVNKTVQQQFGD